MLLNSSLKTLNFERKFLTVSFLPPFHIVIPAPIARRRMTMMASITFVSVNDTLIYPYEEAERLPARFSYTP